MIHYGQQSILGVRWLLRQSEEEQLEWQPSYEPHVQLHDEPAQNTSACNYYFTAARYYCVETICAPCGVVIAWAKFAKSESPTQILDFLEEVYPPESVCPDYICMTRLVLF